MGDNTTQTGSFTTFGPDTISLSWWNRIIGAYMVSMMVVFMLSGAVLLQSFLYFRRAKHYSRRSNITVGMLTVCMTTLCLIEARACFSTFVTSIPYIANTQGIVLAANVGIDNINFANIFPIALIIVIEQSVLGWRTFVLLGTRTGSRDAVSPILRYAFALLISVGCLLAFACAYAQGISEMVCNNTCYVNLSEAAQRAFDQRALKLVQMYNWTTIGTDVFINSIALWQLRSIKGQVLPSTGRALDALQRRQAFFFTIITAVAATSGIVSLADQKQNWQDWEVLLNIHPCIAAALVIWILDIGEPDKRPRHDQSTHLWTPGTQMTSTAAYSKGTGTGTGTGTAGGQTTHGDQSMVFASLDKTGSQSGFEAEK